MDILAAYIDLLVEGAGIERIKRLATSGLAGKHGAIQKYKRSRSAGKSKTDSAIRGAGSVLHTRTLGIVLKTRGERRDGSQQRADKQSKKASAARQAGNKRQAIRHKQKALKYQKRADRQTKKLAPEDR